MRVQQLPQKPAPGRLHDQVTAALQESVVLWQCLGFASSFQGSTASADHAMMQMNLSMTAIIRPSTLIVCAIAVQLAVPTVLEQDAISGATTDVQAASKPA